MIRFSGTVDQAVDTLFARHLAWREAEAREAVRREDEEDEGWRTACERAAAYLANRERNK